MGSMECFRIDLLLVCTCHDNRDVASKRNLPFGTGAVKQTINTLVIIAIQIKRTYVKTAVAIGFVAHQEYSLVKTQKTYDGN